MFSEPLIFCTLSRGCVVNMIECVVTHCVYLLLAIVIDCFINIVSYFYISKSAFYGINRNVIKLYTFALCDC